MEVNHGRHKTSKFAPEDIISNMPDIVITNILDRLPLQYAVRTGVLSRSWRFKWTMLSQLVFDKSFFAYLSKTESKSNYVRTISRILLSLRSGITKVVLSIDGRELDAQDIDNWILFLWRKGIEDLTLENWDLGTPLKLPTYLFSCIELKHLKLLNCRFHTPPSFHGFPNLLSLELTYVQLESSDFLAQCPVLEILKTVDMIDQVKLCEIAKLENLKILSLCLYDVHGVFRNATGILELVDSLPKLEELHLYLLDCKFTEGGVKKRFPTAFPSLKALELSRIDLDDGMELSFALDLIKSFSNLQTLEITTTSTWADISTHEMCFPEVDYNAMEPLQLRNVVFTSCCIASEKDLSLIKFLLSCSPFLRKLVIHSHDLIDIDDKFLFAKKLLKLQRAYPAVDIDLSQF